MKDVKLIKLFQQIEDAFNAAVVSNDVGTIKKCITEDWVLVDCQGGIIPQERFFSVVESGQLTHSFMTKEILRVNVYSDIALVTGRCRGKGTWQGQPLETDEWVTDVYQKIERKWLCILTHLTPVR